MTTYVCTNADAAEKVSLSIITTLLEASGFLTEALSHSLIQQQFGMLLRSDFSQLVLFSISSANSKVDNQLGCDYCEQRIIALLGADLA